MKLDRVLHSEIDRGVVKLWVVRWMRWDLIAGITQSDGQTFRQSVGGAYFSVICCLIGFFVGLMLLGSRDGAGFGFSVMIFCLICAGFPFELIRKVKAVKVDHVY